MPNTAVQGTGDDQYQLLFLRSTSFYLFAFFGGPALKPINVMGVSSINSFLVLLIKYQNYSIWVKNAKSVDKMAFLFVTYSSLFLHFTS